MIGIKNIALCATLLVSSCTQASEDKPLEAKQYPDFDRYVLALSWQTGFCQSMHDSQRAEPQECSTQKEVADKTTWLTVHGLWPGLPKSIAQRGVDESRWMRFGCATRPVPDMPLARPTAKCQAAETGLSLETAARLSEVMPGAGGTSCLERYEYAKHGVCFGFDPDAYFGTMVRLDTEVKQSALGAFLASHYGQRISRTAFNDAVTRAWGQQSVRAIKLTCQGNPAYLTEIQISLHAGNINSPLSPASFVPQPHPGNCGDSFILDAVGY